MTRAKRATSSCQPPLPGVLYRVPRRRSWTSAWAFRRHAGYYIGLGGWFCERCGETFESILAVPTCRAAWSFRTDVWWGRLQRRHHTARDRRLYSEHGVRL